MFLEWIKCLDDVIYLIHILRSILFEGVIFPVGLPLFTLVHLGVILLFYVLGTSGSVKRLNAMPVVVLRLCIAPMVLLVVIPCIRSGMDPACGIFRLMLCSKGPHSNARLPFICIGDGRHINN